MYFLVSSVLWVMADRYIYIYTYGNKVLVVHCNDSGQIIGCDTDLNVYYSTTIKPTYTLHNIQDFDINNTNFSRLISCLHMKSQFQMPFCISEYNGVLL
jgi:hypothetical protein